VAPPPGSDAGETLLLANAAVSSSGDAEQFAVIDGVRYSHIVDPRTGLGLTPSRQVTVVAPDGAGADGLATAACVLGPEAGLALVESTPGTAASVWLDDGTRIVSRGWSGLPRPGERRAAR
jgi:thiamine biosynthesis lipoprotein